MFKGTKMKICHSCKIGFNIVEKNKLCQCKYMKERINCVNVRK